MMDLPSKLTIYAFLFTFALLWITRRIVAYKRLLTLYHDIPGPRFFAFSLGLLNFRAHPPYITPPRNFGFHSKHAEYERFGWDVISFIFAWPSSRATIWVADPYAIKEIVQSRDRFVKPVAMYKILSFYGGNIVASEKEEWKRHRRVAQPAFSEKNNKLVWDESSRIVSEMIETWGPNQDTVEVDHVVSITLPIALMIIGSAGFGQQVSWDEDMVVPAGHKMSFRTALSTVCKDLFLKLLVPNWASGLTQRYRNIYTAFDELQLYMEEMIKERQSASNDNSNHDLFSNLIQASEESILGHKLSPEELMGDTFIFLVAGHETSAHTLAFTFALLALYEDEQELLYQQLKETIPEGRVPTYEDMPLLTRSMAVFYETLRLFPPVNVIPKVAVEDTTLSFSPAVRSSQECATKDYRGPRRTVHIPKDARISIHTPGLHYNRTHVILEIQALP
ncbi:cytochrome P450 [Phellopilus nigrolimitatus]|nr:cytochrome P450 [Phellopilus nigrolimitatus]